MSYMKTIQCDTSYEYIISMDNLLCAWSEFLRGKRGRKDVQIFESRLMDNLFDLHHDLKNKTYQHAPYHAFNISDPKPRNIHKASVRDRVLHRVLYRVLYSFFDRTFIADSYSCRLGRGTHKALDRFREFGYRASHNHTRTVWVLKCDVRKFFASIDHKVLFKILARYISDSDILKLLNIIISSFDSGIPGRGLPLGNLTSQLLVNIYMNQLDQFVKHKLKATYYIRYADDFVVFSQDKMWLRRMLVRIENFLKDTLTLDLHPRKVSIETIASGVDFLGWVHFPAHRILRTITKRRMLKGVIGCDELSPVVQSYRGLLQHGNSTKLSRKVDNLLGDSSLFYGCLILSYILRNAPTHLPQNYDFQTMQKPL
mgnify:CR=1 FL=1